MVMVRDDSIGREDHGSSPMEPRGIERRGLRDRVYDSILEMLMRGNARPGERLSIDTIARQLGVSPTPVREALVQLERTGLVTREALKGYRVAPPLGKRQLSELFDARQMLEVTAARLASPATPELIAQLEAAHARHQEAGAIVIDAHRNNQQDVALASEYFSRDRDFHDVVFENTHNRYLISMSADLGAQLHRLRQTVHRGVTDVHEAIAEHGAILEAFRSGDAESAISAMAHHIDAVRMRALREDNDE